MPTVNARRRALLGLMATGTIWPLAPLCRADGDSHSLFLSSRADGNGAFRVSGIIPGESPVFDIPLPGRGHSFAVHPRGHIAVHFARRPGRFAAVLDLSRGWVTANIDAPSGRHFYGHGVFSPDGRLLYTTENDFDGERGVVGVYRADESYRRAGELPSHGAGPHELRLLADGETLVVANGGIVTHPDLPRIKLNLPTMSPSLAYIDRRSGSLLERVELAESLHQLSIRHIAVGRSDLVAVAMQYQGPAGRLVPLLGTHRRGDASMKLLDGREETLRDMKQYCGSIAFDVEGRLFAATAPRGNMVSFWDARTGALLSTARVADGCGVAPGDRPGRFVASSGRGGLFTIDAATGAVGAVDPGLSGDSSWDNHLVAVRAG